MDIPAFIARTVVRRPRLLQLLLLIAVLFCAGVLWRSFRLDTEVLNLLPSSYESVAALRVYNIEFEQARELTFLLSTEGDPAELEAFEEHFIAELAKESWVARYFYRPPMETEEGRSTLDAMTAPMLLNLPPEEFKKALALLEPTALRERLGNLRERMESPSPMAEFQLELDPTGLVTRAMAPLAGHAPLERGQPMATEDGKMRLVLVVTKQKDLNDRACKALMIEVHRFMAGVMDSWYGDTGAEGESAERKMGPRVDVTGRSAFVDEISSSMQNDLAITMGSSILLVCFLFFFAFRRFSPLIGIGTVLLLSCLFAMTVGALIFGELNILTIGFCSILIGLGVDFGVLLYADYQETFLETGDREEAISSAISDLSKSILYGAGTTSVAFLALVLSDSQGFTQLGVLIAAGVLACALLMLGTLFLFVREQEPKRRHDYLLEFSQGFNRFVLRKAKLLTVITGLILVLCIVIAALPNIPMPFDANPRNLEPQESAAGQTLRRIESKMARKGEPFLLLHQGDSQSDAFQDWQKLGTHLDTLVRDGVFQSAYTPQALVLSPERQLENAAAMRAEDIATARAEFRSILEEQGFQVAAFESTDRLLERLQTAAGTTPDTDWRKLLPPQSMWRFLIDRYFGDEPGITVAFVTPAKKIQTEAERDAIKSTIADSNVPVSVSGWSFTLIDLLPWTKGELYGLSGLIGVLIMVLLFLSYRDYKMWLIHCLALLFAITGMMTTLKLLSIPLTLLNVLAFPLILGVGVDYGLHTLLARRHKHAGPDHINIVLKSVILGAFTTIAGFGSLVWANNPSLSSLGQMCAIGVVWCLATTLLFMIPAYQVFCSNSPADVKTAG